MSRRAVLTHGAALLASAALPVGTACESEAAVPLPVEPIPEAPVLPVSPQIERNLRHVRERYASAIEEYLTTGDADPIRHLRLFVGHRFGYSLGLQARDDNERAMFREAGVLMAQMETEFPEVPWCTGTKERYAVLRRWAEGGGQYALLRARNEARRAATQS